MKLRKESGRVSALFFFACALALGRTETGEINGAQYRIDIPDSGWNGSLVLYCHGYSGSPGKFGPGENATATWLNSLGFAAAQSGYAAGGWAVEEAIQDTMALRRHFVARYGAPKEVWVTGHSMGGFLTMALLEKFPNAFDGGLALCGPLAPVEWFGLRHAFDLRVVFDYYHPGVLPPPDNVPADFTRSAALNQKVEAVLAADAAKAATLRRWSGVKTDKELASTLVFFTFVLKDWQERGGGNPFDNRNTVYTGTPDDNALNDGAKRYAAAPRAAEYLRTWYTPTGRLTRPMLAIHTTYDPLVPPWVTNIYGTLAAQAGSDFFVQQYVKRDGHCTFQPAELTRGLEQLRAWKSTGKKPPAGAN